MNLHALWHWMATPLSGAVEHTLSPALAWHGRLMVLAWGGMIPLGILLARYWKIAPKQDWPNDLDNKLWWHGHRTLQWSGVVLAVMAVVVLLLDVSRRESFGTHALAGYALMAIAVFQVAHGLTRGSKGGPTDVHLRGDHYDMTPRRVWFEQIHKSLGWGCIPLSVFAVVSGLVHADAPRWMFVAITLWWLLLLALAVRWQRAGRCIDTYQAIWGDDPALPGNQRKPIGWGIARR